MADWMPLRQIFPPSTPPQFRPMIATDPQASLIATQVAASSNKTLMYESQKSAGLACFLNFIVPGFGYIYAGRWVIGVFVFFFWGLMLLCGFITLGITFFIASLIWLIGLIDGFLAVNRSNQKLAQRLLS